VHDRRRAVEGDPGEGVRDGGGAYGIHGDLDVAVVRFLKPTGIDSPEPSWRWIWLSVVRAPIAPQQTASDNVLGMIGSRNSQPHRETQ